MIGCIPAVGATCGRPSYSGFIPARAVHPPTAGDQWSPLQQANERPFPNIVILSKAKDPAKRYQTAAQDNTSSESMPSALSPQPCFRFDCNKKHPPPPSVKRTAGADLGFLRAKPLGQRVQGRALPAGGAPVSYFAFLASTPSSADQT